MAKKTEKQSKLIEMYLKTKCKTRRDEYAKRILEKYKR